MSKVKLVERSTSAKGNPWLKNLPLPRSITLVISEFGTSFVSIDGEPAMVVLLPIDPDQTYRDKPGKEGKVHKQLLSCAMMDNLSDDMAESLGLAPNQTIAVTMGDIVWSKSKNNQTLTEV